MIRWEDPPESWHTTRSIWRRCADQLKLKPGEWACVLEAAEADYARYSCARQLRRYGCQVRTRTVTDRGLVSVWARFRGDTHSDA